MVSRSLPRGRGFFRFRAFGAFFVFAGLLAAPSAEAVFPGGEGRIGFTTSRDGNNEIYTMNSDGSSPLRLTNDAAVDAEPSISPDGQKIAFWRGSNTGCTGTDTEIWSMNADGSAQTRLTNNTAAECNPDWSPDGTKIIFSSFRDGNWEVYVMNANGTGQTRLTTVTAAYDAQPSWSPDGTQIAFLSNRPTGTGDLDVYVMNPDGTGQTLLMNNTSLENWVNWSPNSSQITFARGTSSSIASLEIFKADRNGSNQVQVTTNSARDDWPVFSPDGSMMVSASERDGNLELYRMNADGSNQVRLTNDPGMDWLPDWQALGALAAFPRPGGGTPIQVSLVPAFDRCTSANSTHVAPLAQPSCTPPVLTSQVLTTSTQGRGQGSARLTSIPGNVGTPADEADVLVKVSATDVRCLAANAACPGGAGSDFAGNVLLRTTLRLTDRNSGFGGVSATVQDLDFDVPVTCSATSDPLVGSTCSVDTSADAILPGMIVEAKRMTMSARLALRDPGPNGTGYGAGCPPTCGDGDETTYLEPGVFLP
jgi:Tol biopolymer transport system component